MKKIYLSILTVAITSGLNAQRTQQELPSNLRSKHDSNVSENFKPSNTAQITEKAVLWSDDFSVPANWVMTNQSVPTVDWTIETTAAAMPNAAPELYPFASATMSNGYALINSDGGPSTGDGDGTPIIAQLTTASAIDLTGYSNVLLRFSHNYRWWHEDRGVRVSGDGGATWTDYPITSDQGGIFPNGYPNDQNSLNPQIETLNISAAAGGSNNVLVQFYYNDNDIWAWYWVVDDVEILEQPLDDVQLLTAWFSGSTNEGVEYGRTPVSQLDASYLVGGQIYNFGVNDQAAVSLDIVYNGFVSAGADVLLASGDTTIIEQTETPTLTAGVVYTGTYTATATTETGGAEFGNNVYMRAFEITDNQYSIDGMGNHPAGYEDLDNLGTGSFTDASDGLILGNMYHIKSDYTVHYFRVMLDASTVAGGEIVGTIRDTADWFAEDMTQFLYESSNITVTAAHISAGYVDVPFSGGADLTPGAYIAAVELFSNANSSDIQVVDDKSVAQPWYASMIYYPGAGSEGVYSDGEGFGIRLNAQGASIDENILTGVSVYPNPSTGVISISNKENTENTITVYDMVGNVVAVKTVSENTTIDLTAEGAGVYLVKVANNSGSMVERIIIK